MVTLIGAPLPYVAPQVLLIKCGNLFMPCYLPKPHQGTAPFPVRSLMCNRFAPLPCPCSCVKSVSFLAGSLSEAVPRLDHSALCSLRSFTGVLSPAFPLRRPIRSPCVIFLMELITGWFIFCLSFLKRSYLS